MSKDHEVQIILLHPLDETGLKTLPQDGPPAPEETADSKSRLSGDEWLDPDNDFYRRGQRFRLSGDEAHRIYDAIWRNMDRENNLINQRISWSILLTAGVLTAQTFMLAQVLRVVTEERKIPLSITAYALMIGACVFCALLSIGARHFSWRTMQGVDAAQRQMTYLKRRYHRLKVGRQSLFQDIMRLPRPFGNNDDHTSGNIVAQRFPKAMMTMWTWFAVVEFLGCFGILALAFYPPAPVPPPSPLVIICWRGAQLDCRPAPNDPQRAAPPPGRYDRAQHRLPLR